MSEQHDKQFQMRVSSAFLQRLDEWRRRQPDLPPRAEAVRRLIDLGMAADPVTRVGKSAKGAPRLRSVGPEDEARGGDEAPGVPAPPRDD